MTPPRSSTSAMVRDASISTSRRVVWPSPSASIHQPWGSVTTRYALNYKRPDRHTQHRSPMGAESMPFGDDVKRMAWQRQLAPGLVCPALCGLHLPALWEIFGRGLCDELADDLSGGRVEVCGEFLELVPRLVIQPQHEACAIGA
jgi:hypothetical protein